jgi:S-adenosylmethionine-diacylglycerol 3-amino-3-carboxypropyl transferase
MGRLGRDPHFFQYVNNDVAGRLLDRARYAMTVLDPTENPYLQWILLGGRYGAVLPYALRRENFASIRANLDSLEWHCMPLEEYLQNCAPGTFHSYNLSDLFEYISLDSYFAILGELARCGCPGGRLAYWNMMAPRRHPDSLSAQLRSLSVLSRQLHRQDKAFFYSDFVVEEII